MFYTIICLIGTVILISSISAISNWMKCNLVIEIKVSDQNLNHFFRVSQASKHEVADTTNPNIILIAASILKLMGLCLEISWIGTKLNMKILLPIIVLITL